MTCPNFSLQHLRRTNHLGYENKRNDRHLGKTWIVNHVLLVNTVEQVYGIMWRIFILMHTRLEVVTYQAFLVSMFWLCDLSPHLPRSSYRRSSFHPRACKQLQQNQNKGANVSDAHRTMKSLLRQDVLTWTQFILNSKDNIQEVSRRVGPRHYRFSTGVFRLRESRKPW